MNELGNIVIPDMGRRYLHKYKDTDSFIYTHEIEDVLCSRTKYLHGILQDYGIKIDDSTIIGGSIIGDCEEHTDPVNDERFPMSLVGFSCPHTHLIFEVDGAKAVVVNGDVFYFDPTKPHAVYHLGGKPTWAFYSIYCTEMSE